MNTFLGLKKLLKCLFNLYVGISPYDKKNGNTKYKDAINLEMSQ